MKKIFIYTVALVLMLFTVVTGHAQETSIGKFYTSFDGAKIYYEVKGDGFPVLLVHGFTGNAQGWKGGVIYKDLLSAGYKVIILDLRGNGQSDKPRTDVGYTNDAEAKDIIGLMTSLNVKKYYAVGYSRGSIIASRLLVLDKKRLQKLVLGGMGDGYTDANWPRRVHAYRALMGDTTHHDVDGMINYIRQNHFDEGLLALQQKHQPSTSKAELAKVKIPVLIIRGTEDKENGSETVLQQLIPASKLSYVPGDHGAASNNAQFSATVLEFFK
jgi:pimeloyl-ACP methyl ester carboxylesterase